MAACESTAAESNRRFFVIPLNDDADLVELIAQHPNSWLLDSSTGVMTSLASWKTAAQATKASAA